MHCGARMGREWPMASQEPGSCSRTLAPIMCSFHLQGLEVECKWVGTGLACVGCKGSFGEVSEVARWKERVLSQGQGPGSSPYFCFWFFVRTWVNLFLSGSLKNTSWHFPDAVILKQPVPVDPDLPLCSLAEGAAFRNPWGYSQSPTKPLPKLTLHPSVPTLPKGNMESNYEVFICHTESLERLRAVTNLLFFCLLKNLLSYRENFPLKTFSIPCHPFPSHHFISFPVFSFPSHFIPVLFIYIFSPVHLLYFLPTQCFSIQCPYLHLFPFDWLSFHTTAFHFSFYRFLFPSLPFLSISFFLFPSLSHSLFFQGAEQLPWRIN